MIISITGLSGSGKTYLAENLSNYFDAEVISFDKQSIYAHRERITNPNVEFYIGKGINGKHSSVFHSIDCSLYRKEIKSEYKLLEYHKGRKFTYEEKCYWISYYQDRAQS